MQTQVQITSFLPDFWLNNDPKGHAKRLADFLDEELKGVINGARLPTDIIDTPFPQLLKQFGCWEEAELIEKQYAKPNLNNPEKVKENLRFLTLEKTGRRTEAGLTKLINILFGTDINLLTITTQKGILKLTLRFHNREIFKHWCKVNDGEQAQIFERFIDNQVPLSIREIRFLYQYLTEEIIVGKDYIGCFSLHPTHHCH